MHEIGVVRSMVKTVTAFAEANRITDIAEIVVDVGELSLVIPKYVEDIYPRVVENTFLERSVTSATRCSMLLSTRAIAQTAAALRKPSSPARTFLSARSIFRNNGTPRHRERCRGVFMR